MVLTGGEDGAVRLWNFTTGKMVDQLYGHSSVVRSLAVVPSSRSSSYRFASGADDGRSGCGDDRARRAERTRRAQRGGELARLLTRRSPPGLGSRRRRGSVLECHSSVCNSRSLRFAGAVAHLHPRRRARRGGMRGCSSWILAARAAHLFRCQLAR